MKRRLLICLLVAGGALLSWAFTATLAGQLFDEAKSREEIDMMRVILNTTLDHKLRGSSESDDGSEKWGLMGGRFSSQINGYYLYGQGAVFAINFGGASFPKEPFAFAAPAVAPVPPVPPTPPTPLVGGIPGDKDAAELAKEAQKQAEAANAQMKLYQKDLAKQLENVQEQTKHLQEHFKHWRVEQQADRAKMAERIEAAKGVLIEALAKHGDSLTVVKPQEYITLILSSESGHWFLMGNAYSLDETQIPKQILSVQKSVISDYKAGKFSLEEFKKKVLSYTN